MTTKHVNVDEYMASFPKGTQHIFENIRTIIKENAPDALEEIAYNMPAYKISGRPLLYFAGYKHHIGVYATPSGHEAFSKELSQYKQGKGSVQFPLDQAIPYDLIGRIVIFKREEVLAKFRKK
ncbi:MAG: DUF1801 domain-containing protein [Saprospiraceae bacterium]